MVATSIDYDDKMIVVSCGCIQQFGLLFVIVRHVPLLTFDKYPSSF
jgi:hypothetical protein